MKVKDLKKFLEDADDEDEVIMASDEEGNQFFRLYEVESCVYAPKEHQTYLRKLTPELKKVGYTEEDLYHGKDAQKAICLWPA